MKAFLIGLVAAVALAAVSWFVLDGMFSRPAEQSFATPSARVGHEQGADARNFSGQNNRK